MLYMSAVSIVGMATMSFKFGIIQIKDRFYLTLPFAASDQGLH